MRGCLTHWSRVLQKEKKNCCIGNYSSRISKLQFSKAKEKKKSLNDMTLHFKLTVNLFSFAKSRLCLISCSLKKAAHKILSWRIPIIYFKMLCLRRNTLVQNIFSYSTSHQNNNRPVSKMIWSSQRVEKYQVWEHKMEEVLKLVT